MNQNTETGNIVVGSRFFKEVLDGLYSSPDVFLREILSNAATALRKREFADKEFSGGQIEIRVSRSSRYIEIRDNGIGISKEELRSVLTSVGESGTQFFREKHENEDLNAEDRRKLREMVGYFGVGLYSGFLVAPEIRVTSRVLGSDDTHEWICKRDTTWELKDSAPADVGTVVRLCEVRPESGPDPLNEDYLAELVTRWVDYCPFPIMLGGRVLNKGRTPWAKVGVPSASMLQDFFERRYPNRNPPLLTIPVNVEGTRIEAHGVLYAVTHDEVDPPVLLVQGVPVESTRPLLPDWADFVCGLVDCPTLPMKLDRDGPKGNSPEFEELVALLQKKLLQQMTSVASREPETWRTMWGKYGEQIIRGALDDDQVCQKLGRAMMFPSTKRPLASIRQYIERAGGEGTEEETTIWYTTPELAHSRFLESFDANDVEVLRAANPRVQRLMAKIGSNDPGQTPRIVVKRIDQWEEFDQSHEVSEAEDSRSSGERPHEFRVIESLLASHLGGDVESTQVREFSPATEIARLGRVPLDEDLEKMKPMLEHLGKLVDEGGAFRDREDLPGPIAEMYRRSKESGIDLDDMVQRFNRRTLIVNQANPTVVKIANWVMKPSSEVDESVVGLVARLLLCIARMGSGELRGKDMTHGAHQTCSELLGVLMDKQDTGGSKEPEPR